VENKNLLPRINADERGSEGTANSAEIEQQRVPYTADERRSEENAFLQRGKDGRIPEIYR
jgi:hypothetical protein